MNNEQRRRHFYKKRKAKRDRGYAYYQLFRVMETLDLASPRDYPKFRELVFKRYGL